MSLHTLSIALPIPSSPRAFCSDFPSPLPPLIGISRHGIRMQSNEDSTTHPRRCPHLEEMRTENTRVRTSRHVGTPIVSSCYSFLGYLPLPHFNHYFRCKALHLHTILRLRSLASLIAFGTCFFALWGDLSHLRVVSSLHHFEQQCGAPVTLLQTASFFSLLSTSFSPYVYCCSSLIYPS